MSGAVRGRELITPSYSIVPHIGNKEMGEAAEKAVEEYNSRLDLKIITDRQIIQVDGENLKIL